MTNKTDQKTEGQQPEALANFAATSRSGAKVSPTGGREETAETRSHSDRSRQESRRGDAGSARGRAGTDQRADEAVDALPDRTRPRKG